jgi:hypothetical protein
MSLASNPKPSATGIRGVWRTRSGSFACRVKLKGRYIHLGVFPTLEQAKAYREHAVVQLRKPTVAEAVEAVLREVGR